MADLLVSVGADLSQYEQGLRQAAQDAQGAGSEISRSLGEAARSTDVLSGSTLSMSQRMMQARSGTSALRDGLIGISIGGQAGERSLMAMGHHITTLYNETGSLMGVMNALKTSMLSFGGVILIISALAEIYTKLSESGEKAKEEQSEFAKAVDSANKSASEEIAKLTVLYDAATNDNLTRQDRIKAVKELQNEYPAYFSNLSQEAILAGKASDAYDRLTKSIINQAVIKAGQEKLQEAIKPLVDIIAQQEALQARIDKKNADAQKNNPSGTQSFDMVDENGNKIKGMRSVATKGATNQGTPAQFIVDETKEAKEAGEDQLQTLDQWKTKRDQKIKDAQDTIKKMVEDFGVDSILPKDKGGKDTKDAFQVLQDQIDKMEAELKSSIVSGSVSEGSAESPLTKKLRLAINQLNEFKETLKQAESGQLPEVMGTKDKSSLANIGPGQVDTTSKSILDEMQAYVKLSKAKLDLHVQAGVEEKDQQRLNMIYNETTKIIGTGMMSAFQQALSGSQNFFTAFGQFIQQLIEKLIAAAAAAAILTAILGFATGGVSGIASGFSGGFSGTATQSFGNIFGQLSGFKAFADGGIVTGPTHALIGEAGETEAVLPLSKLQNFVNANHGGNWQPQPMLIPNGLFVQWQNQATKQNNRRT